MTSADDAGVQKADDVDSVCLMLDLNRAGCCYCCCLQETRAIRNCCQASRRNAADEMNDGEDADDMADDGDDEPDPDAVPFVQRFQLS